LFSTSIYPADDLIQSTQFEAFLVLIIPVQNKPSENVQTHLIPTQAGTHSMQNLVLHLRGDGGLSTRLRQDTPRLATGSFTRNSLKTLAWTF
jgi:hypothetical protein